MSEHPYDVSTYWHDRAKAAEAEVRDLRAKVAAVEALIASGATPDGEPLPEWVSVDDIARALASVGRTEPESSACCGHVHTPDGCSGPPTPSDVWAGVSSAVCDCDGPSVGRTEPGDWFRKTPESLAMLERERKALAESEDAYAAGRTEPEGG